MVVVAGMAAPVCGQRANHAGRGASLPPAVIFVEATPKAWTDGYAGWMNAHPAIVAALDKGSGLQIKLSTPFLDYFGVDGKSVYSNTSAAANIDFLHKLPQFGEKKALHGEGDLEPTAGDYLEMFPKLDAYKASIVARKRPVLLTICTYEKPECVQQNQALSAVKSRATALGIQVVEVKLEKIAAKNAP